MEIIIPVILLGALGVLFAVILGFASNAFAVQVDPKVEAVRSALPGVNCGACGHPGCDGLASAIALHGAPVNSCPVGGAAAAEAIAKVMGVEATESDKEVACVMCQGSYTYAHKKFDYIGIQDCRAELSLQGGSKACSYGCLGCGTCVNVCPFDAIHMVDGVAFVDKDKCTACRKCVEICPRHLIEIVPYDQEVMVKCKSHDLGKNVRQVCKVGCIACNICVKQCPDGFVVEDKLSRFTNAPGLDPEAVANAIAKCPTKCIHPGLKEKEAKEKAS